MKQYGFLIDMQHCYGCKTCTMACKSENLTPLGVLWRRVREFRADNPNSQAFITMACNHCNDPQCLRVCPVGAYTKREDGIVIQEHTRCIGCRMCIMACPYNAPAYDPAEGKTSKCDFCAQRLEEGLQPRCVESCPAGVLRFGEIEDLRKEHDTNWVLLEQRYGLPNHRISGPNIVIVSARE